jgi:hypothetical protein
MAATHYKLDELVEMGPEMRAFLYYWVQEVERNRFIQLGRTLGTYFQAGDIRRWARLAQGQGYDEFEDSDPISIPLTLALKPELKDWMIKLTSGLGTPQGYTKGKHEVLVDMGRFTKEEYVDFLTKRIIPERFQKPKAQS